jgi:hypothetical protein
MTFIVSVHGHSWYLYKIIMANALDDVAPNPNYVAAVIINSFAITKCALIAQ